MIHHCYESPARAIYTFSRQIYREEVRKLHREPITRAEEHRVAKQEVDLRPQGLLDSSLAADLEAPNLVVDLGDLGDGIAVLDCGFAAIRELLPSPMVFSMYNRRL